MILVIMHGIHYVYLRLNDADDLQASNTHCKAMDEIKGHDTSERETVDERVR